jgi:hypothetical protein
MRLSDKGWLRRRGHRKVLPSLRRAGESRFQRAACTSPEALKPCVHQGCVPAGLVWAVPEVDPAVLFTAYTLARTRGKTSADLMRMFGLSVLAAKTITAYAASGTIAGTSFRGGNPLRATRARDASERLS